MPAPRPACSFEDAAPHCAALARACFVSGADHPREVHLAEASSFFSKLAERALAPDKIVDQSIALIEAANGTIRISDVCRKIGIGERQLNRKFKRIVGVSPKHFARILQMNWVVGLLYADDKVALTKIAQEAGFYDQAHFTRAMQQFFNEGPRQFLRSDHPAFRSFLAASRHFGPGASPDAKP